VPAVKTAHVKPTYRAIDELMGEQVEFVIIDRPEPELPETSPVLDSD
jgi:hypothetical protein